MESTFTGNFGVLRMERERIEVTSNAPRTNKAWTYTDEQGHEHHWRDGYPTLRWVVDRTYWCPDCRDEHEEGHWECSECGEHVEPDMLPPSLSREFIPGLSTYYLNDELISEDEARRIIEKATTQT